MTDLEALAAMADLEAYADKYLFARLKEHSFADERSKDAGLMITGFYYLTIRLADGAIDGRYYDSTSSACQRVQLQQSASRRCFAAMAPL